MQPDLVSFAGGGNDVLRRSFNPTTMLARFNEAISTFRAGGADVVIFRFADVTSRLPGRRWILPRVEILNRAVGEVAEAHGARLVDLWHDEAFQNPRMWSDDRLHLSSAGHVRVAARVLSGPGRARRSRLAGSAGTTRAPQLGRRPSARRRVGPAAPGAMGQATPDRPVERRRGRGQTPDPGSAVLSLTRIPARMEPAVRTLAHISDDGSGWVMVTRRGVLTAAAGVAAGGAAGAALTGVLVADDGPVAPAPPFDPNDWASVRAQHQLPDGVSNFAAFVLASHPAQVRDAIERHRAGLDRDANGYLTAA